jgi:hypothetical protein
MPAYKDAYTRNQPEKRRYNRKHAHTRGVIERAFGLLKARFRVLLKQNELSLGTAIQATVACVILHNVCEMRKEAQPTEEEINAAIEEYRRLIEQDADPEDLVEIDQEQVVVDDPAAPMHVAGMPLNRKRHGNNVRDAVVQRVSMY